ncbi:hypothetical protein [Streptomyces sp. SP18CS02]|uniref:hypothetical protein n=1 Tax=Streptomyces sp. SP18CS02 TaxID=3002531 RepID=UPI002E7784A8|nr:hypothetical protein [Streptomyces sp. SP18CS02]MEE1751206.1 hypothetical protein [Streptomyces sp. SP18CS02]
MTMNTTSGGRTPLARTIREIAEELQDRGCEITFYLTEQAGDLPAQVVAWASGGNEPQGRDSAMSPLTQR